MDMNAISRLPIIATRQRMHVWRAGFGLLIICMVFAQMLWSAHQIRHLLQHDQGVCSTCVGLAGVDTPATALIPAVAPPATETFTYTLGQRLAARATSPTHHPRAPPTTISPVT